jgi:signal transduction histidine kinase
VGTRALEARLTARFLALTGSTLVAVGIAAIVVTRQALDRGDTDAAERRAVGTLDGLDRELGEGDSLEEAQREVVVDANADGARVAIYRGSLQAGRPSIPALRAGTCATFDEASDAHPAASPEPWRACAAERAGTLVVAEVPIATHRAVARALWMYMLAIVAAALAAAWFAIRRAVKGPLDELSALVEWTVRVGHAEPTVPPPPARTREIVRLGAAFDALVRRLLDALARERASSAHIAHELRTPLTAIVMELQALAARDPLARRAVERVLGDVARFGDVIDAILVLSSTSAGTGGSPDSARARGRDTTIVNLADLARELAPAGATVEAPEEALVETDERLVRLALRNLVENARKYASGARIVRVTRAGSAARLAVIDAGPGLNADARERMFDRFWRGSADGDGRGLGLALVRAVAELCGGKTEALPGPGGTGLDVSMTIEPVVGWHDGDATSPDRNGSLGVR